MTRSARRAAARIERLRARDGDECWICGGLIDFTLPRTGRSTEYPLSATFDHIVQRAHGGPTHDDNLRLAHKCCNHWLMARDFTRPSAGLGLRFGLDRVGHARTRVRASLLRLLGSYPSPRFDAFRDDPVGRDAQVVEAWS